jgi:hypothetical protein
MSNPNTGEAARAEAFAMLAQAISGMAPHRPPRARIAKCDSILAEDTREYDFEICLYTCTHPLKLRMTADDVQALGVISAVINPGADAAPPGRPKREPASLELLLGPDLHAEVTSIRKPYRDSEILLAQISQWRGSHTFPRVVIEAVMQNEMVKRIAVELPPAPSYTPEPQPLFLDWYEKHFGESLIEAGSMIDPVLPYLDGLCDGGGLSMEGRDHIEMARNTLGLLRRLVAALRHNQVRHSGEPVNAAEKRP